MKVNKSMLTCLAKIARGEVYKYKGYHPKRGGYETAPEPKSSGKGWEYCPSCGGVLDTGWECLSCKADWRGFAALHPGIEQAPKAAPEATTLLFSNEKDVQS